MNPLLLYTYLAGFSLSIPISALLSVIDIRNQRNQKLSSIVILNHRQMTSAAFVFDLMQVCLSVAGIVGTSIALSAYPGRIEALWLDVVATCHSQLLVGNYVRHLSIWSFGH